MRKLGELFYINDDENKNIYAGVLIGYRAKGIFYLPVYEETFEGICYPIVKDGKELFVDPCTIKKIPLKKIDVFATLSDKEFLEIGDRLAAAEYYEPTYYYEQIENKLTDCLAEKDKKPQSLLAEKLKKEDEEKASENAIKYQKSEDGLVEHQVVTENLNMIEEKMVRSYDEEMAKYFTDEHRIQETEKYYNLIHEDHIKQNEVQLKKLLIGPNK